MRTRMVLGTISVALGLLSGCGSSKLDSVNLKQMGQQRAGDYTVTALSPTGNVAVGNSTFVLEFRRTSDNQLADPGNVKVTLSMPMSGMAPMFGAASAEQSNQLGRYHVTAKEVSMAGTWYLAVNYAGGSKAQLALVAD
jgi:YtkA-like protein